ncbi:MAG: hypothetical protein R3E12_13815 [Candidatus Eisenbacteria bacterium]
MPVLNTPFLTDIDSRAAVKGYRDPLGIQQIWTRLGRYVVGNLTTVTTSVRDFTTHIVGFYFAEQLAEDLGPGSELATFLKWEQLCGYSRAHYNDDWVFRGTERVRRNLREGGRVTISDDLAHQILSNQKTYGLWGLYTMPGRASGLVDATGPRLTPAAREFVERVCLPRLSNDKRATAQQVLSILRTRSSSVDIDSQRGPGPGIAHLLDRNLLAGERRFYREHLLYGGPEDSTQGRQRQLAELLAEERHWNAVWSPALVSDLIKAAQQNGEDWAKLVFYLARIKTAEAVLAPVAFLFSHLMGLEDKTIEFVGKRLREQWGPSLRTVDAEAFLELSVDLEQAGTGFGPVWSDLAQHLATGAYEEFVTRTLDQNAQVMLARGGTPWIELRDGRLHIRYREEQGPLPSREELSMIWRFPYFLDSVRAIGAELAED